jgi:hypothetical protein
MIESDWSIQFQMKRPWIVVNNSNSAIIRCRRRHGAGPAPDLTQLLEPCVDASNIDHLKAAAVTLPCTEKFPIVFTTVSFPQCKHQKYLLLWGLLTDLLLFFERKLLASNSRSRFLHSSRGCQAVYA